MPDWLRWLLITVLLLFAAAVLFAGAARRRRAQLGPSVRLRDSTPAASAERVERGRRQMVVSVLGWLVVALVVAGCAGGGLLWFFGWPRLPSAGQFDVPQLLDLVKIALSVVAGFGGVVLLAVNYRKQRVAEDEHDLAVERAEREVVQKFNERLGSAAEQLAHESPAVRLTGVYALTGLADDWEDKRQVCVDVLCGYLRLEPDSVTAGEAEVRQTILRMIRERTSFTAPISWSDLDFDFTGITFENADFARLEFAGAVIFDGAEFRGAITSFAATVFSGTLSCHGARFAADETTFARASFGARAVEFVGAEFVGEELDFSDGRLSAHSIDFYRCRFAANRVCFSGFTIFQGWLRLDRCAFDDLELDLSWLETWPNKYQRGLARLLIDNSHLTRCRMDFGPLVADRLVFWLKDSVLDTVTLVTREDGDYAVPWLNARRLELRGGTELPKHYLREF